MEMKEVLNREGRDAKNLLVYKFRENSPEEGPNEGKVLPPTCRRPPVAPSKSVNSLRPTTPKSNAHSPSRHVLSQGAGPRVRSASTGRDKKSELQARYWALLFGNLQRAVNEIYQTVECYENISSCQEAILVLENYVRDFKALSEWFKVSWDYESRPLQQRPHSLAWEVRKSNPAPRVRAKSLSSPTASGKSSPCLCPCNSGKTSPCCGSELLSPRKGFRAYEQLPNGAMRVNVRELFASSKRTPTEQRVEIPPDEKIKLEREVVELNDKRNQFAQTDLEDDHLTLADIRERDRDREKARLQQEEEQKQAEHLAMQQQSSRSMPEDGPVEAERNDVADVDGVTGVEGDVGDAGSDVVTAVDVTNHPGSIPVVVREPTALEMTELKLNAMENELLAKDASKEPTPPTTELSKVEPTPMAVAVKPQTQLAGPSAADVAKKAPAPLVPGVQNSPLKYSSVLNRPAIQRTNTKSSALRLAANTTSVNKPVNKVTANNSGLRRSATTTSIGGKAGTPTTTRTGVRTLQGGGGAAAVGVTQNHAPPARPLNKTESYGPPSNVASRLSARSRTMIDMNSNDGKLSTRQHPPARLSQTTLSSQKSSREDIGSSSSTLKASNERISSSRGSLVYVANGDDRRSEPKQLPSDANDGWLTVKNRRRSSLHWANRFNQPTGYASLPTLALLNEKREEEHQRKGSSMTGENGVAKHGKLQKPQKSATEKTGKVNLRPEIKNAKAKVNSLPTYRKYSAATSNAAQKPTQEPLAAAKGNPLPSRQTIIKRQKSDLTGLKMTSLHKEFMRSEKHAQRKQTSHASDDPGAESKNGSPISNGLTNGDLANSEGLEQTKIDIKIQTNRDFSKTIGDLYESISLTAKSLPAVAHENGVVDGKLSSCDENEETQSNELDCDDDQRMLVEEQESLERQIRELESTEIDVDTETDETDCEVVLEHDHEGDEFSAMDLCDTSSVLFVPVNENGIGVDKVSLELRYQALLSDMSWVEREEVLATLQAYVSRHPGRAQELHQKLSSPSRRRSLQETLKKYQAKQARAQQKRELLQRDKTIKIQQLLARVEDVKSAKHQLIEDKRLKMEGRLQRAAENREQYLRQIIEKAHDEEKKLKEINFIKSLEAQNKRLDLIESTKDVEVRLQDLEQERQKRLEEKAAKEAAVERRRQELEKERQRKLEKMNESRLEKEQRIGKMQELKERQRQALAREKARDREERLLALQVQQQQTTEELQRKILQKQKESARRHEENIEHIRQRALELTIPLRNLDENGNAMRGANGEEAGVGNDGDLSSTVSDVGSREHTRSYKKKMKKLKQRMSQSAEEYMSELQPVPLHMKRESQVPKYLNLVTKGGGTQGLERPLGQLLRLMAKAQVFDFQCFLLLDGLGTITKHVILKGMEEDSDVPKKAVVLAVQLYRNACTLCPQIARHALLGNSITLLFDALFRSLQLPEEKSPQHPVELSTELMLACTVALAPSYSKKHTHPKVLERLPDLISYAVTIGLIEILSRRCMKIRESIEGHQSVVLSLLATLGFLTRFIDICPTGPTDTTRFFTAAKSTELFGSISMLYASVVPIGECIPPRTISLAAATFNLLVSMAVLDLPTFQDAMSSEMLSLRFLDVVTILLKYCGCNYSTAAKNSETTAVIIDLIATVGFFCANNKKNQDLLTSEQCSVIVKSLTKLPEHFNVVVYPCLVTITFQNQSARVVIARDFNIDFLDEYSKSENAKKNRLVALLKGTS